MPLSYLHPTSWLLQPLLSYSWLLLRASLCVSWPPALPRALPLRPLAVRARQIDRAGSAGGWSLHCVPVPAELLQGRWPACPWGGRLCVRCAPHSSGQPPSACSTQNPLYLLPCFSATALCPRPTDPLQAPKGFPGACTSRLLLLGTWDQQLPLLLSPAHGESGGGGCGSMLKYLRTCQTVFQSRCSILHSCQQCIRIPTHVFAIGNN